MKKTIIILLLFITTITLSTTFIPRAIEDEIYEAELIIQGQLISKYAKMESLTRYLTDKDGEVKFTVDESVFTTFTFTVDKILKGSYPDKQIKIKMIGGCYGQNGRCVKYSFNYDYDESERGVLFLKYSRQNKSYQMTQASDTAYGLDKNNNLRKKSSTEVIENNEFKYLSDNEKGELVTKKGLNINTLNSLIRKVQNED